MTRTTNARLAGVTFLVYLAAGIGTMMARGAEVTGLLNVVTSFSALVLGVTLWALTREVDSALAMMALACRLIEAAPGPGEIYFAVGSTLFSWLLLRGRLIPIPLAWLGVIASGFLVALIALQLAGLFGGARAWSSPVTWFVWLPMLIFEVSLALWLLIKGVGAAPYLSSVQLSARVAGPPQRPTPRAIATKPARLPRRVAKRRGSSQ